MTGYSILKKVCALLGYQAAADDTNLSLRMTEIIKSIGDDLHIAVPSNLSEEFIISEKKKEAFIYGCAMMLAISLSDGSHATFFAELYSAKRTSALSEVSVREDVLPSAEEEI